MMHDLTVEFCSLDKLAKLYVLLETLIETRYRENGRFRNLDKLAKLYVY